MIASVSTIHVDIQQSNIVGPSLPDPVPALNTIAHHQCYIFVIDRTANLLIDIFTLSHCLNPPLDYSSPLIKSSHHRSSSYPKHQTSSPPELHVSSMQLMLLFPQVAEKPPQKKSCGQEHRSHERKIASKLHTK